MSKNCKTLTDESVLNLECNDVFFITNGCVVAEICISCECPWSRFVHVHGPTCPDKHKFLYDLI